MVTLRDVAERAGVSAAVVSAAIAGSKTVRMSQATRDRVERVIAETGYRTNHAARSLKTSRTGVIAAVVPKITNPVFDQALRGVQDAAEKDGRVVFISDAERAAPGGHLMSQLAGTGLAEGFIVRSAISGEALEELVRRAIPYVVLNDVADPVVVGVWVDDRAGIKAATQHLLTLGHRRICLVGGQPTEGLLPGARARGFLDAFGDRGFVVPEDAVHQIGYEREALAATVTALLGGGCPPTALVVDNAWSASGALAAAADAGVSVPDQLSIIAYHDIAEAAFSRPALTTVRMPVYEAGYHGYLQLRSMIEQGRASSSIVRSPRPKVVQRGSTARLR